MSDAADHFAHCLDLWLRWMRGDLPKPGYPGLDSVCGRSQSNYMAAEDDSDLVYQMADWKLANTVDACVESLSKAERHAVYLSHGLLRGWPFINMPYERTLLAADTLLRQLVARRC